MSKRAERLERLKMEIGRAVAAARRARGLSQQNVADKLSVEQETISRLERGSTLVPLNRLMDIAQLFEVPLASFLVEAPGVPLPADQKIGQLFALLSPVQKQHVLEQTTKLCEILLEAPASE